MHLVLLARLLVCMESVTRSFRVSWSLSFERPKRGCKPKSSPSSDGCVSNKVVSPSLSAAIAKQKQNNVDQLRVDRIRACCARFSLANPPTGRELYLGLPRRRNTTSHQSCSWSARKPRNGFCSSREKVKPINAICQSWSRIVQ